MLVHPPPDRPTNSPYVRGLHEALRAAGIEPVAATVRNAIRHPNAAVHIQWPEHLLGHPQPAGRLAKLGIAWFLLLDIRRRGRQSIWTAHNLEPHRGWSPLQARFFARWRNHLTDVIVLCKGQEIDVVNAFPDLRGTRITHIPSGSLHVPLVRSRAPLGADEPVCFLHLGTIAPYKRQVDVLAGLAPALRAGRAHVTIAGFAADLDYFSSVAALANQLPNVDLIERRVSEDEVASLAVNHSAAVGIQDGFNTGLVAAMVPLGLPVVLCPGRQASFYRQELGGQWITELAGADWDPVLEWARAPRTQSPDLSLFDWHQIAGKHAQLLNFRC